MPAPVQPAPEAAHASANTTGRAKDAIDSLTKTQMARCLGATSASNSSVESKDNDEISMFQNAQV
jgi:hypothetical protein